MNLFGILRVASRALAKNKARALLTMLGIIIGVGAVIAMVALGQGARASVEAQIANMGSNVIMIFPGTTTQGGVRFGAGTMTTLTEDDAAAIRMTLLSKASSRTGVFANRTKCCQKWHNHAQRTAWSRH